MNSLSDLIGEHVKRRGNNRKFLMDNARAMRGLPAESPDIPDTVNVYVTNPPGESEDMESSEKKVSENDNSRAAQPQQVQCPTVPNGGQTQPTVSQSEPAKSTWSKLAPIALGTAIGLGGVTAPYIYNALTDTAVNAGSKRSLLQVIEDESKHLYPGGSDADE